MLRSLSLFIGLLAPLATPSPHDYHVGIHNITYNAESQTFQITHKVFVDDLESALRLNGNKVKLEDSLNTPEIAEALSEYLLEHFVLAADHDVVEMNYLGAKWEDYHTLLIFRESEPIRKPHFIELKNDMFLEVNDDQQHMHYFKIDGEEKGLPTMKGKEGVSLTLPFD